MANHINLKKLDLSSLNMVFAFKEVNLEAINLSDAKKAKIADIDSRMEGVRENRECARNSGMSLDDVIRNFPLSGLELEKALVEKQYKEAVKPLRDTMKACYALIPDSMYPAYCKKIDTLGECEVFTLAVTRFFINMGMTDGEKPGTLRKSANQIASLMGARLRKGEIATMTKTTFNKLFLTAMHDWFERCGFEGR